MRRAIVVGQDPLLPQKEVFDDDFDEESGGNGGGACPTLRRSYRANPRRYHIGACCGLCFVVLLILIFCGTGLAVLVGSAVAQGAITGPGMAISGMHVRDMMASG